ncbi:SpoIIE family protein phosphatase [Streptomyces sp. NPDC053499]|uniref:PP2C family protein-serine/threonine phosphatase n=1 Tax=Streptomyces sp. NPDC053499 TaxID=3365707 RepID=UPI0037D4DD0B
MPASQLAPSAARALVSAQIGKHGRAGATPQPQLARLTEDAELLVSELVTNALVHAGTRIEVACEVETSEPETHPGAPRGAAPSDAASPGPASPGAAPSGAASVDAAPSDAVSSGAAAPAGSGGVGSEGAAGGGDTDAASTDASATDAPATGAAATDASDTGAADTGGAATGADAAGRPVGIEAVRVEVTDAQPAGRISSDPVGRRGAGRGLGLQLVGALAESWGVTYRRTEKAVWFRVAVSELEPRPSGSLNEAMHRELVAAEIFSASRQADERRTAGWTDPGGAFLAEAGELLAGQLDADMVAALVGQLLVPRLADWCAVWLTEDTGGMRLSRVWHSDERKVRALRLALEPDPPPVGLRTVGIPWPWPGEASGPGRTGSALAFSLVAGGTCLGSLVIGRSGATEMTSSVARTVEDVARRVAQAVFTARQYTRQTSISHALQRKQLPRSLADIPGVETAIVYEPHAVGQTVGGDFYDLFPLGGNRWSFMLGDVQGKDPEAMSVTGLTRHLVRLLAREGHGVASVLGKLNATMAEESAEAVAVAGEGARPRFLSVVYGELEADGRAGGARCTVASAGHPPPLKLSPDGGVVPVVEPQLLLGIDESADFVAYPFDLAPGQSLLCVTDGVTERRSGPRQLDDDDGLARIFAGCAGMGAAAVAERVRQATHDFGPEPLDDDLAILVLHATAD